MYVGLDVSTQGCKVVVIDDQQLVYTHSVNYDKHLSQYNTKDGVIQNNGMGVSESEPSMWIDAVGLLLESMKLNIDMEQIRGIDVSGQQHGLVSLDKNGNLSKKTAKLWNDFSTQQEVEILTQKIGGDTQMMQCVQNIQRTGYTLPKIFKIYREEKDVYDKTDCFFLVHNYVNYYLTGIKAVEYGDSSGTGYFNIFKKQYEQKVLQLIDDDLLSKLPEVKDSKSVVGKVKKEVQEKYGLSNECEVVCGCGDNMMSAIGTGNIDNSIMTISLGTSGTIYRFNQSVEVDHNNMEMSLFCDSTNNYLQLICISNMANGYNQILRQYDIDDHQFEQYCRERQVGNEQKWIVPWWTGERTPDLPNAQPIFHGFQLNDINDKPTVCRGILEGHILNLYYSYQQCFQSTDDVQQIRLTGGLANSLLFRQTIADIFDKTVVHVKSEGAALGAAIHARWVLSTDQSIHSLQSLVNQYVHINADDQTHPIEQHSLIYSELKTQYCQFVDKVRK